MDDLELCLYDLEILQNHHLCAFVANLKIDAIYALYLESFCDKNLAIRKVFAFCDSGKGEGLQGPRGSTGHLWDPFVPSGWFDETSDDS